MPASVRVDDGCATAGRGGEPNIVTTSSSSATTDADRRTPSMIRSAVGKLGQPEVPTAAAVGVAGSSREQATRPVTARGSIALASRPSGSASHT